MTSKYKKLHQQLANELGTSERVIKYVRPRLMCEYYSTPMELFDSVKMKILRLEKTAGYLDKSIQKRLVFMQTNPLHKEAHKRKMENAQTALASLVRKKTFLREVGNFLSSIRKDKKILDTLTKPID